ncbi:hypothetical protein CROQUDRAFT_702715, partial [Cronartium quercuum f. sp. fusiforme G11]
MSTEAWLVAFSIQQWNNYMNNCFDAIGYSISTTSSVVSSMVVDMFEDLGVSKMLLSFKAIAQDVILAGCAGFLTGLLYASNLFVKSSLGFIPSLLLVFVTIASVDAITPKLVETDFGTWSQLSLTLTRLQQNLQKVINKTLKKYLESGISTKFGIFSAIKSGFLIQENSTPTPAEMEQNINYHLQAKILNKIMRSNNLYITRASDPCHFSGVAGARAGNDIMSYCDSEGVLWEIVRAQGKGVKHEIYNANLISNRYGFSLETIIQSSWACQTKYLDFEHETFDSLYTLGNTNSTDLIDGSNFSENKNLTDLNPIEVRNLISLDECLFNLPVCDCALPDIHLARASKKHHTTKICREIGKLPI